MISFDYILISDIRISLSGWSMGFLDTFLASEYAPNRGFDSIWKFDRQSKKSQANKSEQNINARQRQRLTKQNF